MVLRSVNPVTLAAWVREARNAENRLQMIRMYTPKHTPKTPGGGAKSQSPKPMEPLQYQRLRQGLCLRCGELGYYAAFCPMAHTYPRAKALEQFGDPHEGRRSTPQAPTGSPGGLMSLASDPAVL
ncbi:UNVERIFIED_CONTAM: hypothetical protein K2H54_025026 [Gekko kuhli]